MSPDMNPIEHVWDFIGRKINQCNPKCQNIDELRTATLQAGSMWPSVVVHEHWPVSQRMIVEMGTTRGASTLSRYFWPVRLPSRTYKSNLQAKDHQGMQARRPIKRPQLTLRHRHARFDWSHDHLGWTIRTWRRVHWTDDGIVWTASCCKKCCTIRALCGLALSSMNIGLSTNAWLSKWGTTRTAFGGGGVTIWGCFFLWQ
jgi:hypothetical protein